MAQHHLCALLAQHRVVVGAVHVLDAVRAALGVGAGALTHQLQRLAHQGVEHGGGLGSQAHTPRVLLVIQQQPLHSVPRVIGVVTFGAHVLGVAHHVTGQDVEHGMAGPMQGAPVVQLPLLALQAGAGGHAQVRGLRLKHDVWQT
eukprot:CAMPEP_0202917556 /NCGR_PEP_ID=MMETSP1392-20130828/71281_1 /ASSEMBLY_ACC=CAM_ASM_000868 /TAXON_ID=225041 /ORGANISM="Chlamydomonas chlamydogama, Strain SAG 11-48b" /LENGTH=144 /DNA_ID=CAMNT_0049610341 /DNA_START=331 /DNA_END=765 /DNA_ORIENTATION=-